MKLPTRLKMTKVAPALAVMLLVLLVACGDGDAGLSPGEVAEIVRAEMAETPPSQQPEPGLTSADVEEAIRAAMADIPQQEPGVTRNEVEGIVKAAIDAISTPQPGLTSTQVEDAIRTALADMPQPGPGLTSTEAERIARGVVASIPPKSSARRIHQVLRPATPSAGTRPRVWTPPSPTTTARRASTASGTCSSSTRTIS